MRIKQELINLALNAGTGGGGASGLMSLRVDDTNPTIDIPIEASLRYGRYIYIFASITDASGSMTEATGYKVEYVDANHVVVGTTIGTPKTLYTRGENVYKLMIGTVTERPRYIRITQQKAGTSCTIYGLQTKDTSNFTSTLTAPTNIDPASLMNLGKITINAPAITGTLDITENGEYDVTNYANVNVDVQGGGGGEWDAEFEITPGDTDGEAGYMRIYELESYRDVAEVLIAVNDTSEVRGNAIGFDKISTMTLGSTPLCAQMLKCTSSGSSTAGNVSRYLPTAARPYNTSLSYVNCINDTGVYVAVAPNGEYGLNTGVTYSVKVRLYK